MSNVPYGRYYCYSCWRTTSCAQANGGSWSCRICNRLIICGICLRPWSACHVCPETAVVTSRPNATPVWIVSSQGGWAVQVFDNEAAAEAFRRNRASDGVVERWYVQSGDVQPNQPVHVGYAAMGTMTPTDVLCDDLTQRGPVYATYELAEQDGLNQLAAGRWSSFTVEKRFTRSMTNRKVGEA